MDLRPYLNREYAVKQSQRILNLHNEDLPLNLLGTQSLKKCLGQEAKMG